MSRVIGIDLGNRRVGISVGEEGHLFATPLTTVGFAGWDKLVDEVAGIMQEQGADVAVVGVPRNMDGTLGVRSRAAIRFARRLALKSGKTVVTWDERLTTSQAEKEMIALDRSRRKRRLKIDEAAAVLILEGYLRSLRAGIELRSSRIEDDELPHKHG